MNDVSHKHLLDLSRSFVEQYEDVFVVRFQAYDSRGSNERSLHGQDKSEFMRDKRLESIDELAKLENEPFIKTHYPGQLKHIHDMLKRVHSVTVDLNPKYVFLGLKEISDERQFDLAILRVIAGAASVALDPEWFSDAALEVGAVKHIIPNASVQKKMQNALDAVERQGLELPHPFKIRLKMLAHGIPLITQYEPTEKILPLLIREITLISNHLFIINNSGKDRFSAKAIMAIVEILNLGTPSERTIQSIQELVEDEVELGSPLSLHIHGIPH